MRERRPRGDLGEGQRVRTVVGPGSCAVELDEPCPDVRQLLRKFGTRELGTRPSGARRYGLQMLAVWKPILLRLSQLALMLGMEDQGVAGPRKKFARLSA